jgi:hypothetical protein
MKSFKNIFCCRERARKSNRSAAQLARTFLNFSKDKEDFKVLLKFLIIEYSSGYSGFVSLWITIYQCIVISWPLLINLICVVLIQQWKKWVPLQRKFHVRLTHSAVSDEFRKIKLNRKLTSLPFPGLVTSLEIMTIGLIIIMVCDAENVQFGEVL